MVSVSPAMTAPFSSHPPYVPATRAWQTCRPSTGKNVGTKPCPLRIRRMPQPRRDRRCNVAAMGMVELRPGRWRLSMATSLYLASLEPGSGKSVVARGLMEMLSCRTDGVGYFRPVIPAGERTDARIELIAHRYRLSQAPSEMYAYTAAQVERMLAAGRRNEVFTGILTAYKAIERQCGFVLCDGTDFTGVASALEFEFNVAVANHLGAPVLALVNGRELQA